MTPSVQLTWPELLALVMEKQFRQEEAVVGAARQWLHQWPGSHPRGSHPDKCNPHFNTQSKRQAVNSVSLPALFSGPNERILCGKLPVPAPLLPFTQVFTRLQGQQIHKGQACSQGLDLCRVSLQSVPSDDKVCPSDLG